MRETAQAIPFSHFKFDPKLAANVFKKGYVSATPIQSESIPHLMRGSDIVGIANTGTGKTAAFLLPAINAMLHNPKAHAIVIAPTRELAVQIDAEFRAFASNLGLYSACVVGGAPIGRQISDLRRGARIVIGTPGRIKDLVERGNIKLGVCTIAVLDEADRMLDMGFINDMRFLIGRLPKERQTMFFSATLSPEIERLIGEFLKNPVRVSVKTGDTAATVEQDVVRVIDGKSKIETLHDLLSKDDFEKVLIFGRTKHGVEKLSRTLSTRGFKAESIHGNKSHSKRQKALGLFRDNHVNILVATDVAARGLDISGVSHVINYDLPATYEDYVHRIGRTGRAGSRGKALTFIE